MNALIEKPTPSTRTLIGRTSRLAAVSGVTLALAANHAFAQAVESSGDGLGKQIQSMSQEGLTTGGTVAAAVMYVLAFVCFIAGVWALWESRNQQTRTLARLAWGLPDWFFAVCLQPDPSGSTKLPIPLLAVRQQSAPRHRPTSSLAVTEAQGHDTAGLPPLRPSLCKTSARKGRSWHHDLRVLWPPIWRGQLFMGRFRRAHMPSLQPVTIPEPSLHRSGEHPDLVSRIRAKTDPGPDSLCPSRSL